MEYLLDYLFSSPWIMTILIMVLMFTCIGFSFAKPFKSKGLNMVYKAIMFVLACMPMLAPSIMYYGFADGFKKITMGTTTLCLFEQYERGGESGDETVCRLHIIDLKTGQKKERFYIGSSGELIGQKGDSVFYKYNKSYILYNTVKGEVIYEWEMNNWPTQFKELSSGVESISSNQNSSYSTLPLLQITSKDGNSYWFNPFTLQLHHTRPDDTDKTRFYVEPSTITRPKTKGQSLYYLSVNGSGNNSKRSVIVCYEEGKKFISHENNETYLQPFFMAFDTIQKCYIFGHYTSTDKTNYWIECKGFDQITKWKKDKYWFCENNDPLAQTIVFYQVKNILYFNVGGTIVALNTSTCKKLWSTKL